MREPMPAHAIAIVGMAGRFPQADDLDAFWRNIAQGVESLATLSDAQLDAAQVPAALRAHPNYVRRGTFIEQAEHFDAGFFGYAPREAQVIDPQHRVFLECAWQAIEHAGYAPAALPESVGVYAGASMNSYVYAQLLRNPALAEAVGGYQIMLGNDKDFLCTRVSYKLGLRGPSITVQTACSTSLVAVQVACRALQRGECDMALAGGVSLTFPLDAGYLYQEGMILSPDGHCRPFDADARGTRAGAGAGIVVLKRLTDALAAGDTVHAVIRGIAINNDGAGKAGYTAPSVEGQVEVIATAQALAGVSARSIGYVEAHGTATPLGDPIELAALTQAFRASTPDVAFCHLGSLKANIGHLDAAAGVAGLIKATLVLEHGERPPLVNFRAPNPALQLERSPFTASAAASEWPREADTPRRAAVSSFGIGGTNAHAVLEEASPAPPLPSRHAQQLIVLSARSTSALDAACARLADHLEQHPEQSLADVAYTLQHGREAFAQRRAWVVRDASQAIEALRAPQQHAPLGGRHEGGARPVAFLFSGQGSQHAAMGRGLYDSEPVYRDAIDRCAAILQPLLDTDLRALLHAPDGAAALAETRLTQPALFVTEYALAMLWQHWGVTPQAMLGHSIGEYVAAHLAGVMSLDDALAVVAARGRLMQRLAPGAMAAAHLSAAQVQPWLGDGTEVAAINAPALCSVSGPAPTIERLLARLAAAGIDARALHTSHAFHSAAMTPALAPFTDVLARVPLSAPTRRYVSNLTGTWITPEQATSPAYYAEHLRRAVQFEAGMRTLAADATLHFVEVGPGHALASLARLNLGADGARRVVASMRRPTDTRDDRDALLEAAGRLWVAGVPLRWLALHGEPRRRVPLPTYPFERKRFTVEPAPVAAAAAAPAPGARAAGRADPQRPIDEWFWATTWHRAGRLPRATIPAPATPASHWLVCGDDSVPSSALVDGLRRQGVRVSVVLPGSGFAREAAERFRVRPEEADDMARVLADVASGAAPLTAVLHAWNATAPNAAAATIDLEAGRRLGLYAMLALGSALARKERRTALPLLVLSTDRESVLGTEPLRPERALLLGPAYLMPIDVPRTRCRSIDLHSAEWQQAQHADELAASLIAEAALPDSEPVVAYRGAYRWLPSCVAAPTHTEAASPVLRQGGTYLITGGTGGIGLTFAEHLARSCNARLVLVARTPLPDQASWDRLLAQTDTDTAQRQRLQRLSDLQRGGTEVMVCAADVADTAQMARVVADARARFGAIHGAIHAAGALGLLEPIAGKTRATVEPVLRPKLEGTLVLDRALAGAELDFLLLCSSISTAFASAGMADYSAANAFQDAFARSGHARCTRHVISIGWDSWRDVGFARDSDAAHPALRHAIRPHEGVEALALALALARGAAHLYVTRQDMPTMLRHAEELARWVHGERDAEPQSADAAAAQTAEPVDAQRTGVPSDSIAPAGAVEPRLAAIWSELLGVDGIGAHDDFFELGGHSLMATRVLSRIDEAFGVRLALRDVFDAPTVQRLAARIAAAGATAAAPTDDREELEF